MIPIFKYSGGKSKELKTIKKYLPTTFNRVVEPFCGGGAVGFGLEKPVVFGDIRKNNIDVYNTVKDSELYPQLQEYVDTLKTYDTEKLNTVYYHQRDEMYGKCDTILDSAKRWITIRQLVFSGIDRINKSGKFNAPFGWYDKFSCNLNISHHELLSKSTIIHGGYSDTLQLVDNNDFVFFDPPYFKRNSNYGGDYDDIELFHTELAKSIYDLKANWMMVHIDCDLYRDLYSDYNIITNDYTYSQNFKGRDNSGNSVKHLYITNYDVELESDIVTLENFM